MDSFTRRTLGNWNMQQFVERFANAGIDEEIFNSLDDSTLEKLFDPKQECGFLMKFKSRLANMQAQENIDSPPQLSTVNSDLEEVHAQKENEPPSGLSSQHNSCRIIAVGHSEPLVQIINHDISLPSSIATLPVTPPASNNTSFSSVSSESEPSSQLPYTVWEPRVNEAMPSQRLTFKYLLYTTYRGFKIRKALEEGFLDTKMISDLIIDQEFETTRRFRITRERFLEFAEEGSNELVVPSKTKAQVKSLLFHAFRKASKTKKSVNAGGCVYDKYLLERKWLIRKGVIPKNQVLQEDLVATATEVLLAYLAATDSPVEEVIEKWNEAYVIKPFQTNYKNHFLLYKGLRSSTLGHILWSHDYISMHGSCPNFRDEFLKLTPHIISVAKDKKKNKSDDIPLINIGKNYIVALRCLIRCLTKIVTKRDVEGNVLNKFGGEQSDIQNSFFYHAKTIPEFEAFLTRREEASIADKRPIGPFVSFIGNLSRDGLANVAEDDDEISVFVTVNSINFKVESNSLIEAIDYCYKSFSTLNIPYPTECSMAWVFLQRAIYKNNLADVEDNYRTVDKFIDKVVAKQAENN
ncbi:hypothetical protein QAD02_008431 [Eretmocerus hayati]|uniref:Uncharacterized protein n=1 Tax=Eretmocerus hayati TaxID=131215 RepID=A0ACC2N8V2_9HYME|nr:hypothetical protein QAD02_008431 [Eretmocerus hayati]